MAELDGDTEIINDPCPSALSHGESFDVDLHRLTGEVGRACSPLSGRVVAKGEGRFCP
jgi:hypothetical protein